MHDADWTNPPSPPPNPGPHPSSFPQVEALGIVNIFDQVLDGLPEAEREAVFDAYIRALQQDPAQYRADAAKLEAWAKGLSSPADIKPDASEWPRKQLLLPLPVVFVQ